MECEVDMSILIEMVRDRPALWDKTLQLYKNRVNTKNAWKEICSALVDNFEELSETEQDEFAKMVIIKWNGVRDNWVRSYKKFKEEKSAGSSRSKYPRKYIFFEQLFFLSKIYTSNESEENSYPTIKTEEESSTNAESLDNPNTSKETTLQPQELLNRAPTPIAPLPTERVPTPPQETFTENAKKKKKYDEFETKVLELLEKHDVPSNQHTSFFDSILPFVSKFSEDETIEFRMGVLALIKNIQIRSKQTINPVESSRSSVQISDTSTLDPVPTNITDSSSFVSNGTDSFVIKYET